MFAGIKVAIVLSVTGAIVAEFVAANEGLGYLVLQANYSLDTAFALGDPSDSRDAVAWAVLAGGSCSKKVGALERRLCGEVEGSF